MSMRSWRTRAAGGVLVLVLGATVLSGCALSGVVQVAVGEYTSCALLQGGTVDCWGSNDHGELGRGFVTPAVPGGTAFPTPAPVLGVSGATAVAVSDTGACALLADATVTCWGEGSGTASPKAGLTGAVAITLGFNHGCAVRQDATVVCWGANSEGELGLGTTDPVGPLPIPVPGLAGIVAIDAGDQYTCAVRSDGSVACWGRNDRYQLGVPNVPYYGVRMTSPTTVTGLGGVVGISAGINHTCANLADGTVQCWGLGVAGQLGRGTIDAGPTPAPVVGLTGVTSVSVGGDWGQGATCATLDDGTVRCWGHNDFWELGDLTTGTRLLPTPVANVTGATGVSVGSRAACSSGGGGAMCWGSDARGRLGLGPEPAPTGVPRPVLRIEGAELVSAGAASSCAVITDGSVRCWGTNRNNEAGTGVNESTVWPTTVAGVQGARSISSSTGTCALVDDGTAWCWGGELIGTTTHETAEPVGPGYPPPTLTLTSVSVGAKHRCATRSNGTVRCWGFSTSGQLGDGVADTSPYPRSISVPGIADATRVYAGPSGSCALRAGGTVSCWGANTAGQLGNGTTGAVSTPVGVVGLSGVTALSGAGNHVCGLLADTTLRCWGTNSSGELGDGTTVNRSTPVAVPGVTGVVAVSATAGHTCAVLGDGSVRCWGRNDQGQLGLGSAGGQVSVPTVVPGMTGVTDIANSADHTCASRSDGSVWCWGANTSGKAGGGVRGTFPASVVSP